MSGPTFRRAVPPDRDAFLNHIAAGRAALAAARASGDERAILHAAGALGSALFMEPGSEAEAATLLEEALALSRKRGDRATEIDGLLGLATAIQYLGERTRAIALFEEGLRLCAESGIRDKEHFLLHHLGRCLVEVGRRGDARSAFERALVLREAMPQFAASTRAALAELAEMGQ
ncbi:MAG: tetratricopeptide repeat protein [Proteobacteria bacterium]|nr:tetratricopeptide repeat protein [Pseudomonadota bacterium]